MENLSSRDDSDYNLTTVSSSSSPSEDKFVTSPEVLEVKHSMRDPDELKTEPFRLDEAYIFLTEVIKRIDKITELNDDPAKEYLKRAITMLQTILLRSRVLFHQNEEIASTSKASGIHRSGSVKFLPVLEDNIQHRTLLTTLKASKRVRSLNASNNTELSDKIIKSTVNCRNTSHGLKSKASPPRLEEQTPNEKNVRRSPRIKNNFGKPPIHLAGPAYVTLCIQKALGKPLPEFKILTDDDIFRKGRPHKSFSDTHRKKAKTGTSRINKSFESQSSTHLNKDVVSKTKVPEKNVSTVRDINDNNVNTSAANRSLPLVGSKGEKRKLYDPEEWICKFNLSA